MAAIILVRGGGDLASGVALRLHRAGMSVVITELARPLAVRRTVALAEAVYAGQITIEGVTGQRVTDPGDTLRVLTVLGKRHIPVLVDPDCTAAQGLHPIAIIDARMTKQPPERFVHQAALYVGLGPGFEAPVNCHAAIETKRGHTLGRVLWSGAPLEDTSQPSGDLRRVLRAPRDGVFESGSTIGQHFEPGELIGSVGGEAILAPFAGTLRGLLHPGNEVAKGLKVGDLDPRNDPHLCEMASDKSLAVGGGVLEALLTRPEVRSRLWA